MKIKQNEPEKAICVDVALYGSIARHGGGRHIWQETVRLAAGSTMQDLFDYFGIEAAERGYVFRNATLSDMPGLDVAGEEPLADGDHVGIFAADRAWPYQYRQGAPQSAALAAALREQGEMRHSHRVIAADERK